MEEGTAHRHRRISGQIAACLMVMLAGVMAEAIRPGGPAHAEDQAVDPIGDHANQLFILGQNRESGDWVRPNLVQAYMWYLLAMTAGHGQAAEERARIATGMTADQITAAWSRAGRCLVSGYLYCDEWAEP